MKKSLQLLVVLLAGLCVTTGMSQSSFQLSDDSGVVPNGTIFHVWGDTSISNTLSIKITVKNISSGDSSYKVRKIIVDTIPGSVNFFCFGTCYQPSAYSSFPVAIASGADTSFWGDYKPKGHLGESIIMYKFFNAADPIDAALIVVHFHGSAVGITENNLFKFDISNPFPNPVVNNTSFHYSFPRNLSSAKFVLSDLPGTRVREVNISDKEGNLTINTEGIHNGIYLYSFYVNDKMILTKKLVIQR